jgi:hypothetical protein
MTFSPCAGPRRSMQWGSSPDEERLAALQLDNAQNDAQNDGRPTDSTSAERHVRRGRTKTGASCGRSLSLGAGLGR